MNFKFWFLLFLSVFLPVAALAFWGFRSVEGFQRRSEASAWKKSIKTVHAGYFELLEKKSLFLKKAAEQALAEKQISGESPFYGLILRDSRSKPKKLSGEGAAAWPMALGPPPKSRPSGSSPAAGASAKAPGSKPGAKKSAPGRQAKGSSAAEKAAAAGPEGAAESQKPAIYLNFEAAPAALQLSEKPAAGFSSREALTGASKTKPLKRRAKAAAGQAAGKRPPAAAKPDEKSPLRQLVTETLFRLAGEVPQRPPAFSPAAPLKTAASKEGEGRSLRFWRFYIFPSAKTAAAVFSYGEGQSAIAFLKDKSFFTLSPAPFAGPAMAMAGSQKQKKAKKSGEAFLIDSRGRMIFHTSPRRAHKAMPLKSSLLKSIKARKGEGSWFLKIKKKDGKRELFYIKKWPGRESFLAARQSRGPFVFQGRRWLFEWGGAHGLAALLIFLMAALTARPLAGAYSYMKSAFIHIGKTGRLPPFPEKSKNPFLSFYGNWRILVSQWLSDRKKSAAEPSKPAEADESASFQSLARSLAEKLKLKHPGLAMEESFRSDVRLWGFEHSMKMILRELFLNAIEAMGGSQSQKVAVSSQVESDQFVFSVRDYGAGAAKEDWEKMLQLYYSTKSQLGAGLNVADSLVRAEGGQLRFSSPEGGGFEVQVLLPMKCFLKRTALESALKEPSLKSASFADSSQPDAGRGSKKEAPPAQTEASS